MKVPPSGAGQDQTASNSTLLPIDGNPGTPALSSATYVEAKPCSGGKSLRPQQVTRQIVVPEWMTKLMIFVVDMTSCKLADGELRQVIEMKEDIQDALGIVCEGKRMQVLFSGYDGPRRKEINNDEDLNYFFEAFGVIEIKNDDDPLARKKHDDPKHEEQHRKLEQNSMKHFNMTKEQLTKLRLGNCVTKIQMRKYLRLLGDQKQKLIDIEMANYIKAEEIGKLKGELGELKEEFTSLEKTHEELVESVPGQIELAAMKAVHEAHQEWKAEKELEIKKLLREHAMAMAKQRAELEQKKKSELDQLQTKMRKEINRISAERDAIKEDLAQAFKEIEKMKEKEEEMNKKIRELDRENHLLKEDIDALNEQIQGKISTVDEERKRRIAELEEQYESCRKQLEECIRVLEENNIPVPGRVMKQESTLFKWHMMRVTDKFKNYSKEHSIQSPEFTLWGIKGLQAEFFPAGIGATNLGWSAIKLRIPRLHSIEGKTHKVSLKWKVVLEDGMVLGPRVDEFCDNYWWCKKGMVVWPNFGKADDLVERINERDSLNIIIEIIDATVETIEIDKASEPKRNGANSVQAIKDIHEASKLRPGQELLISYKGKILEDKHLLDMIMDYITGIKSSVSCPKNIGSVVWENPGSPVGRMRPQMAQSMQHFNSRKKNSNSKNKLCSSLSTFPSIGKDDNNQPLGKFKCQNLMVNTELNGSTVPSPLHRSMRSGIGNSPERAKHDKNYSWIRDLSPSSNFGEADTYSRSYV